MVDKDGARLDLDDVIGGQQDLGQVRGCQEPGIRWTCVGQVDLETRLEPCSKAISSLSLKIK